MNYQDNFSLLSPEEPYLLSTSAGVFGGAGDPVDFLYGGSSALPDGSINPEDFAAFPKELFDEGIIQPGQPVRVINPKTKKKIVVIARHAKSEGETGLDLAPHSYLELGAESKNDRFILDLRPVKGYPVAMYPRPEPQPSLQIPPEPVDEAGLGLTPIGIQDPVAGNVDPSSALAAGAQEGLAGLDMAGTAPIEEPSVPGELKFKKNANGSLTYESGVTVYPDGHWTEPVEGGNLAIWYPGMKAPKIISPKGGTKDSRQIAEESAARKFVLRENFPAGAEGDQQYEQAAAASLTGDKGGGKMTQDQRKELSALGKAGPTLEAISKEYDALEKRGKAGFVAGNIERGKSLISQEDPEYATANARIRANLFGFARALQGAGVLTEKDIQRMEEISPTLQQNREQFYGRLKAVKDIMKIGLQSWKITNAHHIDPDLEKSLNDIDRQLSGESPGNKPASTPKSSVKIEAGVSQQGKSTSVQPGEKDSFGYVLGEKRRRTDPTTGKVTTIMYAGNNDWTIIP